MSSLNPGAPEFVPRNNPCPRSDRRDYVATSVRVPRLTSNDVRLDNSSSRPTQLAFSWDAGTDRSQRRGNYSYSSSDCGRADAPFQRSADRLFVNSAHHTHVSATSDNQRSDLSASDQNFGERLAQQLSSEKYDCMVCCDIIRLQHPIWSCKSCFNVFHLRCIKRWSQSSQDTDGWRCPTCQNVTRSAVNDYRCFCGYMRNPPKFVPGQPYSAHSCGELCRKERKPGCVHKCPLICHPGACPPCAAIVKRSCNCGKTETQVRCENTQEIKCSVVCTKPLNCGVHLCTVVCHSGCCKPCTEAITQRCFCGENSRSVICSRENVSTVSYGCGQTCHKPFICGVHFCSRRCHDGVCEEKERLKCPYAPENVTKCCCTKMNLSDLDLPPRTACTDPLAVCGQLCEKPLNCGPAETPHLCHSPCHEGECPPCNQKTECVCRCGRTITAVPCQLLNTDEPIICAKRCNKKKACKKHKCSEVCCSDREHLCTLICGAKLNCGQHACDQLCHGSTKCRPCYQSGFSELACFCGAQVLYPPIACGTKPPACANPCMREHSCRHPVTHTCSDGTDAFMSTGKCVNCTFLTSKPCYGGHTVRKNIPCYLNDVSCGMPCNKPLPCGLHFCQKACHGDACVEVATPSSRDSPTSCNAEKAALMPKCNQPCPKPRESCGHPCSAPCHGNDMPCPQSLCKASMKVTCGCGNRVARMLCYEVNNLLSEPTSSLLPGTPGVLAMPTVVAKTTEVAENSQASEVVFEQPAASALNQRPTSKRDRSKCLDCTSECKQIERNRRLADALDINSADLSGAVADPIYTDFLKSYAKSNLAFIQQVEKALIDLITLANTSKTPTRSHSFAPMNRDQRRTVHEYSDYFNIVTVSYDAEPKRNVVATATKDLSQVPVKLLSASIPREQAQQRIAPPIRYLQQ